MNQLHRLLRKYTVFPSLPDIARYRRITGTPSGTCAFIGCTEPVAWEDPQGKYYLCEGHYDVMVQWITEANRALIQGGSSALFREPE